MTDRTIGLDPQVIVTLAKICKKVDREALRHVHVRSDGQGITYEATDSYILLQVHINEDQQAEADICLRIEALHSYALKATDSCLFVDLESGAGRVLGPRRGNPLEIPAGVLLADESTLYPNTQKLLEKPADDEPASCVAFDPQLMHKVADALKSLGVRQISLRAPRDRRSKASLTGETYLIPEPMIMEHETDMRKITALLMPMKQDRP